MLKENSNKIFSYILGTLLIQLLMFSNIQDPLYIRGKLNHVDVLAQAQPRAQTMSEVNMTSLIPNAESIYNSERMRLPTSVGTFVILIANEAHESWQDEKQKLITDRNPYFVPKSLVIPQGTNITFLDADAPWDTPHPHTIEVTDTNNGNVVYGTGVLDYTDSSDPITLPVGNYTIADKEYDVEKGTITVTQQNSDGNLLVGGFYSPSIEVENKKDNDGGTHPGSLEYYTSEFPKNGFQILSAYNFTYAACDYCPGKYWPDNKTGNQTLIVYATDQPMDHAIEKLKKLVRDNVYI